MVQLKILSGKKAGVTWAARRFPVRIGRAASADLQLEDSGVWDQHLLLGFDPATGVVLTTQPNALAWIQGEPVQQAVLHNGDTIQLGCVQVQFWLSETRQGGLRWRETVTWLAIGVVVVAQAALLYWLLKET